jgi:hypothetical protein
VGPYCVILTPVRESFIELFNAPRRSNRGSIHHTRPDRPQQSHAKTPGRTLLWGYYYFILSRSLYYYRITILLSLYYSQILSRSLGFRSDCLTSLILCITEFQVKEPLPLALLPLPLLLESNTYSRNVSKVFTLKPAAIKYNAILPWLISYYVYMCNH